MGTNFVPRYLFCQTYKIFFNLYVFIRKNTYFYIFKSDVLSFSTYKEFRKCKIQKLKLRVPIVV